MGVYFFKTSCIFHAMLIYFEMNWNELKAAAWSQAFCPINWPSITCSFSWWWFRLGSFFRLRRHGLGNYSDSKKEPQVPLAFPVTLSQFGDTARKKAFWPTKSTMTFDHPETRCKFCTYSNRDRDWAWVSGVKHHCARSGSWGRNDCDV